MGSLHPPRTPTPAERPATTNAPAAKPGELVRSIGRSWVPVRSLAPRHRARVASHLIALDTRDRYLRFGYPATDAQITKYVDTIDFAGDEVFGIFNRRLQLIAMAHLAHAPSPGEAIATSEFGVSVLPQGRGRGFGRRLFEHAMLHARNRGVDRLMIHALSENSAMLKIARDAGATVVRDGSESDATLQLPPDTIASHIGQIMSDGAAELDFQFKIRALQVNEIANALSATGKPPPANVEPSDD